MVTGFLGLIILIMYLLTENSSMGLGININDDYGLSGATAMTKQQLVVDPIQLLDMPFGKSVEVVMSGRLLKEAR